MITEQPQRTSAANQLHDHQDDIRIRSHQFLQLDDNKSGVNCQQA